MSGVEMPDASARRRGIVARCRSIADLRAAARRRLPRAVFDFIDGGAEDERTLAGNAQAYADLRFQPKVLVDVSEVSAATRILGAPSALPAIVAPYGAAGFAWPHGDLAGAQAAAAAGIPYAMSSTASVMIEDVAARSEGRRWFQCYIFKRREITAQLVERARRCGFETLIVTVDLPVGGNRERDYRNDFAVPFRFTPRNFRDFAIHPGWSLTTLRYGMPTLANLTAFGNMNNVSTAASTVGRNYDPSFDWDDLKQIRDSWRGKLVVKGVARGEDAARIAAIGADAVSVSNHGGRQLDGALPSLLCLPEIRSAVGRRMEVFVDGGIRRGTDIVKALALGADAVMLGRAVLYGVAAGGGAGAQRSLEILTQELTRTMQLAGVASIAEIGPHLLARTDIARAFDAPIAEDLLARAALSARNATEPHNTNEPKPREILQ